MLFSPVPYVALGVIFKSADQWFRCRMLVEGLIRKVLKLMYLFKHHEQLLCVSNLIRAVPLW